MHIWSPARRRWSMQSWRRSTPRAFPRSASPPTGSVATEREPSSSTIRERIDGYAQIGDYAAVGDGRTVALVARDGAIDWLCLPDLDSPSVFGALLDNERGGRFVLEPESVSGTQRRYLPGTNVLETTFTTATGVVRVTDAMTLPTGGLSPYRELGRKIEGLAGEVPVRWRVEPRLGYASSATRIERPTGVPIATAARDAIAVCSFGAGEATTSDGAITGHFTARA